jgi:hypothetical protein
MILVHRSSLNTRLARLLFCVFCLIQAHPSPASDFRVAPYLQHPTSNGMTIIWFSNSDAPGQLEVHGPGAHKAGVQFESMPYHAVELSYPSWESNRFFGRQNVALSYARSPQQRIFISPLRRIVPFVYQVREHHFFSQYAPAPPYRHRIRIEDLLPAKTYQYTIRQSTSFFSSNFTTAPAVEEPIRFIVYADSETEPESTGKYGKWPDIQGKTRPYLLDQTDGYENNLSVIQSRKPHFVAIPGDLVESGGEQRDWDEFWRHITNADGEKSLASSVPFLATPGNHEYYESPIGDRYNQPGSQRAIDRYQTYFEFPTNDAPNAKQHGLYHRTDYGPITLIALDVANGGPHKTDGDTNFFLLGENDEQGGNAPDFKPGSTQYTWLEKQLADAQQRSAFTFVYFHHVPYSVGPHGWTAGECSWHDWWELASDLLPIGPHEHLDTQSGVPVRILTPLFMRYGVDAVFSGHDEMFERSELHGNEHMQDGSELPHVIHFYDVGIGGDGLRGPQAGLHNPHQTFLAHTHAPEVWQDSVLIDGGKHYGHLEVDILPARDGRWQAVMKPVYVFPVFDSQHNYLRSERRLYDDIVTLTERIAEQEATLFGFEPTEFQFEDLSTALLRYHIMEEAAVQTAVYSDEGEQIRILEAATKKSGLYSVEWDGRNDHRQQVGEGTYTVQLVANGKRDSVNVHITR